MENPDRDEWPQSADVKAANPKLLAILKLHREGGYGRETYQSFLEELVHSVLLIPSPNAPPGNIPQLGVAGPGGERIQVLLTHQTAYGKPLLTVFTDETAFARFTPQPHGYMELRARDIFALAQHIGVQQVLINPNSTDCSAVDYPLFAALASGRLPNLE
jgi:hypothetical protein